MSAARRGPCAATAAPRFRTCAIAAVPRGDRATTTLRLDDGARRDSVLPPRSRGGAHDPVEPAPQRGHVQLALPVLPERRGLGVRVHAPLVMIDDPAVGE